MAPSAARAGYASVNGLNQNCEIRGRSKPLLIPRGCLMSIDTSFGGVLPVLACLRRDVAVEPFRPLLGAKLAATVPTEGHTQ